MNSEKKLILAIVAILFIFSALIFSMEKYFRQKEYAGQWFLSFSDVKGQSMNFEIKNESPDNQFTWALLSGKKEILKKQASVAPGNSLRIDPTVSSTDLKGKLIITVTDSEGQKRDIYKIFPSS